MCIGQRHLQQWQAVQMTLNKWDGHREGSLVNATDLRHAAEPLTKPMLYHIWTDVENPVASDLGLS